MLCCWVSGSVVRSGCCASSGSSILVLPVELLDPEDEGVINCWDLHTELQCHILWEFYIRFAWVDSIYIERDGEVECICICLFKTPVGDKCQKHNWRLPCFSFCPVSNFIISVMVVVFDTSICCCSWYSIIYDLNLCSQQYNLFVGNTDILHFFKDFLMFVFRSFCYYRSSWWLCLAIFC
jgi:hypothetical protein